MTAISIETRNCAICAAAHYPGRLPLVGGLIGHRMPEPPFATAGFNQRMISLHSNF